MDARWLRYGLYGALIGFALGFLAGYLRARHGRAAERRRTDREVSMLHQLLVKFAAARGVSDDETDN